MKTLASLIQWEAKAIHGEDSIEITGTLDLGNGKPFVREIYVNARDVVNHGPHLFYLCWMQQEEIRREVWG